MVVKVRSASSVVSDLFHSSSKKSPKCFTKKGYVMSWRVCPRLPKKPGRLQLGRGVVTRRGVQQIQSEFVAHLWRVTTCHNLSQPDAPEKNKKNTPAEVGTLVLRGGAACVCWNILGGQRNRENLMFIYVFAYGHLFIYIYIPIIIYMSCYIYIYIIVNTCTFISTAMSYIDMQWL